MPFAACLTALGVLLCWCVLCLVESQRGGSVHTHRQQADKSATNRDQCALLRLESTWWAIGVAMGKWGCLRSIEFLSSSSLADLPLSELESRRHPTQTRPHAAFAIASQTCVWVRGPKGAMGVPRFCCLVGWRLYLLAYFALAWPGQGLLGFACLSVVALPRRANARAEPHTTLGARPPITT